MFLNTLIRRNGDFIRAAAKLHQEKLIPSNCYVLDLDTIEKNIDILIEEANRLKLTLFPMTKQINRNPDVLDLFGKKGIIDYVAVDINEARVISKLGKSIGHLGHLVQVPAMHTDFAARIKPKYWTVFTNKKASAAAKASHQIGHTQPLLARIHSDGDIFYRGHEGGFDLGDIVEIANMINNMDGAAFSGITTFPTLLFDESKKKVLPTPNLSTLQRAADMLSKSGINDIQINAPGTTSSTVMHILAQAGATQVEPGHAITGTTPLHALEDLPEIPAMLYLSEVSHCDNEMAYCYGGGLYIDPVFSDYKVHALYGSSEDEILENMTECEMPAPVAIDYYGRLYNNQRRKCAEGDTVIFCFRAQAFVTRAYVASVRGASTGTPEVLGIYNSEGDKAQWLP